MKFAKSAIMFPLLGSLLLVSGCDSDSNQEEQEPTLNLQIMLNSMSPLTGLDHYRVWALTGLQWSFSNGFNYNQAGLLTNTSGQLISNTFLMSTDVSKAEKIVIAIHGKGGVGSQPSTTVILAGDVVDGSAQLSVADDFALGENFMSAGGTYTVKTLETTSDAGNNLPKEAGIWFGEPSGTFDMDPSLQLPNLPPGWLYAGWIEVDEQVLPIGRFEEVDAGDMDNLFVQEDAFVPVPGENFILNPPDGMAFPLDVRGHTIYITLEPESEDGTLVPTTFRVLQALVPASAQAESVHPLVLADGLPSGTVVIQ